MVTLTGDERSKIVQDAEFALMERRFTAFLDQVRILEPPPGRAVVPFETWPHLVRVTEELESHRLLVWLKARQIGASWLLAAYILWTAQYHYGAKVGVFSKGQEEAQELLAKVRFVYAHLPGHLQYRLGVDNTEEMSFPVMESVVHAYPSTSEAGRSMTFSLAVFDEADFHPNLETSYMAVKPTTDDIGGQIILVSTANLATMTSLFKGLYRAAPGNGFAKIFYGWGVRPGRDQEWLEKRKLEYPDQGLFAKEYPTTEEEALAPAQKRMAFDLGALEGMQVDVRVPIERIGAAQIWQKYQIGKRYGAGTDTSHGVGQDEAVTVVLDLQTGYVVADIQSAFLSPEELAYESERLLERYKYPIWAIEDNDWGHTTIMKAQELRYPRLYCRDMDEKQEKVGWHTDDKSRYTLWGELIDAVRSRLITIPSKGGLEQFYTVIRNVAKGSRIEAMEGARDDYPLAVGVAWQMRKYAAGSRSKAASLRRW